MENKIIGKKILVAMSGGVDSTVAVKLLMDKGYSVSGATMKLLPDDDFRVEKTRNLAESLGIPFYCFDLHEEFKAEVIGAFAKSYMDGLTPNPCVVCNQKFKFGLFLEKALELGFDYIATGHYATIREDNGEYLLCKSKNIKKDQSYFIYGLNQEILKHVIFPLEDFEKEEIREIAENLGLLNAHQKDSQDICFVENGEYMKIVNEYALENKIKLKKGKFISADGKILGENMGIERYTIGQRKGVGMALGGEKPLYVVSKNPKTHEVVMGEDELLYSSKAVVKNVSFVNEKYKELTSAEVKTRYAKQAVPCTFSYNKQTNEMFVNFETEIRAVTPGQYAVLYQGDVVLGGGEICLENG